MIKNIIITILILIALTFIVSTQVYAAKAARNRLEVEIRKDEARKNLEEARIQQQLAADAAADARTARAEAEAQKERAEIAEKALSNCQSR